jgi:putative transposase
MTRPYSEDLRARAIALADGGATIRQIGMALKISPSCVSKWRKLRRESGGLAHGKVGGHKKRRLSGDEALWLEERVRSGGPFTLRLLVAELAARDVKTECRAVSAFLRSISFSFKKNHSGWRADPA